MTPIRSRPNDALRPVVLKRRFTRHAEGSVLVSFGDTQVLCTASVEPKVPGFLRGRGQGWLTAEYGMLPRSTHTRMEREAVRGKQSGRTQEIQRLIGRSLRAVVDLTALGERTITVDCDVLQADGGTRTASITGACLAISDALRILADEADSPEVAAGLRGAMNDRVAAVSVGLMGGQSLLDLNYEEDSGCDTDMNLAMTASGGLIEVQGTAEGQPFSREQLDGLIDLAVGGLHRLHQLQAQMMADPSLLEARLEA